MNPLSFKGTADRFEWWFLSIVGDVLAQVGLIFGLLQLTEDGTKPVVIAGSLFLLAVIGIWAALAVTVRRLRERERPAWLAVFHLLPYVGWLYLIVECGILGPPGSRPRGRVVRRQVTAESKPAEW